MMPGFSDDRDLDRHHPEWLEPASQSQKWHALRFTESLKKLRKPVDMWGGDGNLKSAIVHHNHMNQYRAFRSWRMRCIMVPSSKSRSSQLSPSLTISKPVAYTPPEEAPTQHLSPPKMIQRESHASLIRGLQLKADSLRKGTGIRLLRLSMARRLNGIIGYRVEMWRQSVRQYATLQAEIQKAQAADIDNAYAKRLEDSLMEYNLEREALMMETAFLRSELESMRMQLRETMTKALSRAHRA